MATLSIRLPDSLHRQLKGLAKKEKVSTTASFPTKRTWIRRRMTPPTVCTTD